MKKFCILIVAVVLLLTLAACNNANNNTKNGTDFVGEWKANTLSGIVDGKQNYEISIIELNADGSGTYKGKELVWEYSEDQQTIKVTLTKENTNTAFEIQEENGKTVLKFFQDTYYRSTDFVAKESE